MAEAVKSKRKTRGGHRAYMSKVLPEAKALSKRVSQPQKRDQESYKLKYRLKSSLKV